MPCPVYAAAPSLSRLDPPTPHSPASPCFTSLLPLHPGTWCWINIPNACSGLGSPCLQLSITFRKEVQSPPPGIIKSLWSSPNTSTSLDRSPGSYTSWTLGHSRCACFLQGSDPPTSPPLFKPLLPLDKAALCIQEHLRKCCPAVREINKYTTLKGKIPVHQMSPLRGWEGNPPLRVEEIVSMVYSIKDSYPEYVKYGLHMVIF